MKKIIMDLEMCGNLSRSGYMLSIGMITETEEKFYAERTDYNPADIDSWLEENVIGKFYLKSGVIRSDGMTTVCGDIDLIKDELEKWLSQFERVQIYADVHAYDWVFFCEIWGGSFKRPKNVNYICIDIASLLYAKGIDPDINRVDFSGMGGDTGQKHNALYDAEVSKMVLEKIGF